MKIFQSRYNTKNFIRAKLEQIENNSTNFRIGVILYIIAFISEFIPRFFQPIEFILYLLSLMKYVGLIYVWYSKNSKRWWVLLIICLDLIRITLSSGMFGEIFLLFIATIILMALKSQTKYIVKLLFVIGGLVLMISVQIIKPLYRQIIWKGKSLHGVSTNKVTAFYTLYSEVFLHAQEVATNKNILFGPYFRFNQGLIISMVYKNIPERIHYKCGKDMPKLYASIVVPRLFWRNKPEAGGVSNMREYANYNLKGTSMNISPFGEAYGNFGAGGVFYLIFYIFIISILLHYYLKISIEKPNIILWSPFLFYNILGNNSDTIYVLTGVFKSLLFVFLFYYFMKSFKITLF